MYLLGDSSTASSFHNLKRQDIDTLLDYFIYLYKF